MNFWLIQLFDLIYPALQFYSSALWKLKIQAVFESST